MKVRHEPDCTVCTSRKNNPVFNDCPLDKLSLISSNKTCVSYDKGQHIFYEGQTPLGIFCLYSGKVKIYRSGYKGKDQIVRLARPGDLLGYRALLGDERYSASAFTLEDSVACFLNKDNFSDVIHGEHPNLYQRLVKLLSKDLGDAESKMTALAQKSVRERLAETILLLDRMYNNPEKDGELIDINLSREDIANIVGTATETVIRLISDFKSESLIATEGKKFKILNRKKLMKIGNVID